MVAIQRNHTVVTHSLKATVPACFGMDHLPGRIKVDPNMLKFIQMLNIPIPPDRILDHQLRRRPISRAKGYLARKRWRRRISCKQRVAGRERQKRLALIEQDDRRVACGKRARFGIDRSSEQRVVQRVDRH